jgi:hypothetical protein
MAGRHCAARKAGNKAILLRPKLKKQVSSCSLKESPLHPQHRPFSRFQLFHGNAPFHGVNQAANVAADTGIFVDSENINRGNIKGCKFPICNLQFAI